MQKVYSLNNIVNTAVMSALFVLKMTLISIAFVWWNITMIYLCLYALIAFILTKASDEVPVLKLNNTKVWIEWIVVLAVMVNASQTGQKKHYSFENKFVLSFMYLYFILDFIYSIFKQWWLTTTRVHWFKSLSILRRVYWEYQKRRKLSLK